MSLEIYHQLGWQYIWNLQSITDDGTGDGVIWCPKFMGPDLVASLPSELVSGAIFDPQFFMPREALRELANYDFFPNVVSGGFQTNDYADSFAYESADRCVSFQSRSGFRYITIPARYTTGMPTNFIQDQEDLFVNPFLSAIANRGATAPVLLQVLLNSDMVKDSEYSADLLNWITGITGINGVYLIADTGSRGKQVADIDFLLGYLRFIDALRENDLEVVLGYLNTEAFLLSLADPNILTMGIYENTRIFNIRNFEPKQGTPRGGGPNPRLYMSRLIQWMDNRYIGAIERALPPNTDIFDINPYQALMFQPSYQWHFSKPELYKHHFYVFSQQLRELSGLDGRQRFDAVISSLDIAISLYNQLKNVIEFDADSGDTHLSAWKTAANQFGIFKGWR